MCFNPTLFYKAEDSPMAELYVCMHFERKSHSKEERESLSLAAPVEVDVSKLVKLSDVKICVKTKRFLIGLWPASVGAAIDQHLQTQTNTSNHRIITVFSSHEFGVR